MFLFWAGAFEIAPLRFPDQGVLFDGLAGTVIVLLYFLGVLIHEGGHKVAGWMTGRFYEGNLLTIWGGIPREAMSFESKDSRDHIVRMGGPIFNLISAFPLFHFASQLASHPNPFVENASFFLHFEAQTNLLLAVANMFPFLPFDMGTVLLGDGSPETAVRERWSIQGGLGVAWILTLVSLAVAAKGGMVSGFGGIFLGIHLARTNVVWKARIGLTRYLKDTPIELFIDPIRFVLNPDITIEDAYLKGFYPLGQSFLPVSDDQGSFLGFLSWEELKKTGPESRKLQRIASFVPEQRNKIQIELDGFVRMRLFDAVERREKIVFVLKEGRLVGTISPAAVVERFRMRTSLGIPEADRESTMTGDPEDPQTIPTESP